jgi:hypothetical protein
MLERAGVAEKIGSDNLFHTVHAGAESFQRNGNELTGNDKFESFPIQSFRY